MSRIQFGWSEVDITPKSKISLAGEFFERVTDEVETPITITALAVKCGTEQTIFVSCDLVSVSNYLIDKALRKIKNREIDKDKVIVSAVHIHNSYTYVQNDPKIKNRLNFLGLINKYKPDNCIYHNQVESKDSMPPEIATEFLSDKIAEAVDEAYENLSDGGFKTEFGRVSVGMNRRVCYNDNTAKMWGDVDKATFTELEAGTDNGMELMFVYDKNGKMTGLVSNIACPSQVMEQRSVISADYWGKVKILLRKQFGEDFKVLGLCSAAGDLCPRDLIRWVEPETPILDPNVHRENPKLRKADPSMFDVKGTWLIGKRIVNEINLVLEESENDSIIFDTDLSHKKMILKLPLRRVTESEKIEAETKIREFFKDKTVVNYIDSAELHVYTGTLNRYERQKTEYIVNTEVHVVKLGNVAFATNPFELFVNYGNQIRARSDAEQTFIIQLSCGTLGYLPTELAERNGHYSAYVSSGNTGHEGGDLLVRETLDTIKELFKA